MSGAYMLAVIIVGVIAMILAISKLKIHPFIVMTVIAIAVGLLCGMNTEDVINKVKAGFGNILASIGIVILAGTIIGTILEKTGAALTMANTILKLVGKERSVLTMGLTGYVTGIPVFCDSGFVILSPISRALAAQSNKSLAVMATALSAGLYATHCLVPPTPGPIAMAGTLSANLGLVIGIGLLISLPATFMGILYANKVAGKIDIPANPEYTVEELVEKYGKLPGALHSFAPILVPIILIALKSIGDFPSHPFGTGAVKTFCSFIGNPVVALLLGIALATTLIPKSEKKNTLSWVTDGVTNSAGILAITGAGGAFGEILKSLPLADALSSTLLQMNVGVFLPFIIAAILKSAMGASTVAMILTSAMVAPLMPALGFTSEIGKVLVIMAIGAGSMTVSHANDSYFWVVSQFSDMNTQQAYKCQTGVTLVQGITTIVVVFIVSLFVH
ncbi:GntP family permease [Treponema sp. Marseille-Q4132]|uniref:GntP family permease n=1 Tax=Treponema sp. Marseille-Q4132 TaxID=2766701 RepID=UPI0016533106|nr:GntP family permease [Treponema sp. Marseille-Q4132]QNL97824.1 GntP family permease [Treponema sp. Marseille-Q4132]